MMKMIFKSFAKKLFGTKYERLTRAFFVYPIVFYGLHIADLRVQIAPVALYLTVSVFTAGVMWQALSSEDNAVHMQNLFMLPFNNREFVFSYTAALGAYTLFTKTAALLAVLWGVSACHFTEILGSMVCILTTILMTAAIYSLKKYWYVGGIWTINMIAVILFCGNTLYFIPFLIANAALAVLLLQKTDGYVFYLPESKKSYAVRTRKYHSVWRYLFRYLNCHRNYLTNTVMMWGVALILPYFFDQMGEKLFIVPIGFALLSLNTPMCILLSSDPDLEQAVRFLPGQKKSFCIPYCLFLFLCNMTADVIFLCSLQIQNNNVTVLMVLTAIFFALQSAILSVVLEWFYPIRHWKIESDLWHHPRKYIVPTIMLLLAGAVGTLPVLMPVFTVLLVFEAVIFLFICWRCYFPLLPFKYRRAPGQTAAKSRQHDFHTRF